MSTSPQLLIYGVSGYTGALISRRAAALGLDHIVAGREPELVKAHAQTVQQPYKVFALDDAQALITQLQGVKVVLNAAGPFKYTNVPLIEACLAAGAHYVDLAGEVPELRVAARYDEQAKAAGITIIPGVGLGVVPTDVIASRLKALMPEATSLDLGFETVGGASRGTLGSMLSQLRDPGHRRVDGQLVSAEPAEQTRQVALPHGQRTMVLNPWRADLWSAWQTTQIPHITTWIALPGPLRVMMRGKLRGMLWRSSLWQHLLKRIIRRLPAGPSAAQLAAGSSTCWGQIQNAQGATITATLTGPEAYLFSAETATRVASLLLTTRQLPSGCLSPTLALGDTLLDDMEGVKLTITHHQSA